jgi:hypothetical protein
LTSAFLSYMTFFPSSQSDKLCTKFAVPVMGNDHL